MTKIVPCLSGCFSLAAASAYFALPSLGRGTYTMPLARMPHETLSDVTSHYTVSAVSVDNASVHTDMHPFSQKAQNQI